MNQSGKDRLDNRTHSMTGYNIFLSGIAEGDERDFAIAISEKQQQKLRFHIGDEIRGTAWTKMYVPADSKSCRKRRLPMKMQSPLGSVKYRN